MGERGHELGGADEDLVLGDELRKGRLGYGGGFIAGSANGLEPCQSTGSRGGDVDTNCAGLRRPASIYRAAAWPPTPRSINITATVGTRSTPEIGFRRVGKASTGLVAARIDRLG